MASFIFYEQMTVNETEHHPDLHAVVEPFPQMTTGMTRESLDGLMTEYATRNNFVMVVDKSDAKRLVLQCEKGGHYKHKKLGARKRQPRSSHKINCPYRIRFSKLKNDKGFKVNKPVNQTELLHNHPLDFHNLISTNRGRKNHGLFTEVKLEPKLDVAPSWKDTVARLEATFYRYREDPEKMQSLMNAIESILHDYTPSAE
ncbi:hypothetical protein A0J61_01681 [Choanephora cucurbitarum]|uniref:FAR1 domain-containing protein n=1 Tax=Choanephora cucurbitarum TaxID=101091 RepID=A0A1C7NMF6_9FUNG|nr:hypothetical protein A0J61_01681 [Choanephora cucurbitarum]